MTKFINYIHKAGYRTSMKLTPAREKAMRFLCEYHGFKKLQEYVYFASEKTKDKGNTAAVMDAMFMELVDICAGEKIEILKKKLAQEKPELKDWIEINFGKIRE